MKNLAYLLLVVLSVSTLVSCDKSDEVTDNNRNEVVSYSKDAPMPQYYQSGNGWGLNNEWDDVLGDCRSNPVNCFDPIIIIADAIAHRTYSDFKEDAINGSQNDIKWWFTSGNYRKLIPNLDQSTLNEILSQRNNIHFVSNENTGTDYIIISPDQVLGTSSSVVRVFQFRSTTN